MSRLMDILLKEQEHLWTDLNLQLRMAANEHWSLGVENKVKRILWIADEVGVVAWEKVPIPLLSSGIYAAICKKLGLSVPDIDEEVLSRAYNPMWDKTVEYIDVMIDWEWK